MQSILDKRSIVLLRELLDLTINKPVGTNAPGFRLGHPDDLDTIFALESKKLIEHDHKTQTYKLCMPGLLLANNEPAINLLFDTDRICDFLRAFYRKKPDSPVPLNTIAKELNIDRQRVIQCITTLNGTAPLINTSSDLTMNNATVTPTEALVFARESGHLARQAVEWHFPEAANTKPKTPGNITASAQKREAVLGAALAILATFPEQCRTKTGTVQGTKITKLIEEKSPFLFKYSRGEPPLSPDAITREINKWLKTFD